MLCISSVASPATRADLARAQVKHRPQGKHQPANGRMINGQAGKWVGPGWSGPYDVSGRTVLTLPELGSMPWVSSAPPAPISGKPTLFSPENSRPTDA
jgi:hypothetical protein